MNQIRKISALGLLSLMALTSCEKKNDLSSTETSPQKVSYVSSIAVNAFEPLNVNGESRAIVKSNGYAVPTLDLNKEEFEGEGKLPAHWSVLGGGEHEEASTFNALAQEATGAVGNALYLTTTEPKEIKMYCDVSLTNVTQKSAMFALGGEISSDKKYLTFMDAHSPNAKIEGIKSNEKQLKRAIPLMTEVKAFEKLLAPAGNPKKKKATFNPRGSLIGLCFVNNLDKKITIKKIILEKDNALYFEGKFALREGVDNTNFLSETAVSRDEMLKFYGAKGDEDIVVPVVSGDLEVVPSATPIDDNLKNSLPLFHVWGMSKDKSKKFKFKVALTKEGSTQELTTKSFEIKTPANGFEEGKAYRKALIIDNSTLKPYGGKNPLMFVAEFDINNTGDALMTHHNLPESNVIANHQPTDVGYYSLEKARALFNEDWLKNKYTFPNHEQWLSIIPTPNTLVRFTGSVPQSSFEEKCQVGTEAKQSYKSDYITKPEDGTFVTYALRFKGTPWESAWRYSREGVAGQYKILIRCVNVYGHEETLNTISKKTFFTGKPDITERILPFYGYRSESSSSVITRVGVEGRYRTSTLYTDGYAYRLHMVGSYANISRDSRLHGFSIRPFYKSID